MIQYLPANPAVAVETENEITAHGSGKELAMLVAAAVKASPSLNSSLLNTLSLLREFSGWDLAGIWMTDYDRKQIHLAQFACDYTNEKVTQFISEIRHCRFTSPQLHNAPCWKEKKAVWYTGLAAHPGFVYQHSAVKAGFVSVVAWPVMHRNEVLACIYLFDSQPQQENAALEEMLETVSNLLVIEIERRRSQFTLDTYFHESQDLFCTISPSGILKKVNDTFISLAGALPDAVLNTHFLDWVHTGDQPAVALHLKRLLTEEIHYNFESRFYKDDTTTCIAWSATYVPDQHYYIMIGKDITAQQEAEENLRQAELRYRTFIHQSGDSIFRYEAHTDIPVSLPAEEQVRLFMEQGYLAECNEALVTRYGFSSQEEIIGRTLAEMVTLQQLGDLSILFQFVKNNYRVDDAEAEILANGKKVITTNSLTGIVENGCLRRVWGTSKDITEKRTAERKLAESELRYKMFISQSTEAIFCYESAVPISTLLPAEEQIAIMKEHGALVECNDLVAQQYGKSKAQEITGLKLRDAISFDNEVNIATLTQLVKNGYRIVDGETQVTDEKGNLHILSNNLFGIIENNQLIRIWGTARNITKQRLTQLALEESELRYRMFIAQSTEAIWRFEMEKPIDIGLPPGKQADMMLKHGYLAECNDCMARMYGFSSYKDIIHTPVSDLFDQENAGSNFRMLLDFIRNDYILNDAETFETDKDGNKKVIRNNIIGIIEDGHLVRAWGTQRDITNQRKAEQEVRYLAGLVENVSDAIYSCTPDDLVIVSWNKAAEKIYGVTAKDAIGQTLSQFLQPNYQAGSRENVIDIVLQKGVWKGEVSFVRPGENRETVVLSSVSLLNDEYNKPAAFIITSKDISERKNFEQQLFLSNERYAIVNKATSEAIWDADLVNNKLIWGEGFKHMLGYDPQAMQITTDFWIDKIHPDDRYKVIRTFYDFSPDNNPDNLFRCEYRFMKADGTYAIVSDRAYLIRNEEGKPARMVGAVKDITREKELEAQLVKNEVDKQRLITMATLNGQEKEKQEISKELHDNVNQIISSTKLYLEVVKNDPEENIDLVYKAIENLNLVLQENRRLSKSLAPPTLGHLGFSEALDDLVEDIQLSGQLKVSCHTDRNIDKKLADDLKLTLYRITQEAMNNIIKYAKATECRISLVEKNNELVLSVQDNGIGFDPDKKRKGIGINNIINRAALYSGSLQIESGENKGTTLIVSIPFRTHELL